MVTAVPDVRMSMVEIARRSGVQRPAVSNWRRRHADFPEPVPGTDPEMFEAAAIAAWLDHRTIPRNALKPGEGPGTTFGDRFRRTFGAGNAHPPDAGEPDHPAPAVADFAERSMRILDRLRSFIDPRAHGDVVLALLYLRSREPLRWDEFVTRLQSPRSRISALLDDVLRTVHPEWPGDFLLGGHADAEIEDETPLREIVELLDRALDVPSATDLGPHLFRHLLRRFAAAEGHRGGEFYTPESVVELMIRLVDLSPRESVCDPCCGTGELLAAAARATGPGRAAIRGEALGLRACRLATMHTAMEGVSAVVGASAAPGLREGLAGGERYEVVVTNPPFNVVRWTDAVDPGDSRWRYGTPPGHNANFAWLQHVLSMLTERGRAAVIMPDNATFSSGPAERAIRAGMVEDGVVECLVALPTGLFVTTPGVKTSIWLLRKGRPSEAGVLFIDARAFGERVGRAERILSKGSIERIVRRYHSWLDRSAPVNPAEWQDFTRHVTLAELRAAGYDLNVSRYTAPSLEAFDEAQLTRDVRDLMARLAELREHAARIDARLAMSLREVVSWKA